MTPAAMSASSTVVRTRLAPRSASRLTSRHSRTRWSPSVIGTAWISLGSAAYLLQTCAAGWKRISTTNPFESGKETLKMAVEVTHGAAAAAQRNGATGEQWVYMAGDAPASNRDLLGGKGHGLAT